MNRRFTPEQLKRMDHKTKDGIICQMQERVDRLEQDYESKRFIIDRIVRLQLL